MESCGVRQNQKGAEPYIPGTGTVLYITCYSGHCNLWTANGLTYKSCTFRVGRIRGVGSTHI